MSERTYLYDTTLRDGAPTESVQFIVVDKVAVARMLDDLGVDYIEGGWPGADPTDDHFFNDPPKLRKAMLCAFSMTQRAGRSATNDSTLNAVLASKAEIQGRGNHTGLDSQTSAQVTGEVHRVLSHDLQVLLAGREDLE